MVSLKIILLKFYHIFDLSSSSVFSAANVALPSCILPLQQLCEECGAEREGLPQDYPVVGVRV